MLRSQFPGSSIVGASLVVALLRLHTVIGQQSLLVMRLEIAAAPSASAKVSTSASAEITASSSAKVSTSASTEIASSSAAKVSTCSAAKVSTPGNVLTLIPALLARFIFA